MKQTELEDEIANWLIDANLDLMDALDLEDYKQCIFLRDTIEDFINVNSEIIQRFLAPNKDLKEIINELKNQNEYIFQKIKEKKENLNYL